MAGERKTQQKESMRPSKWRMQHGSLTEPIREADPETGTPVQHHRAVDSLGQMLANGTITREMHETDSVFRTLFRSAALDGIATSQLIRLAGGSGDPLTERHVAARRKVAKALEALGGQDSAAGSCVWHVVGCEDPIREWATRRGWAGRSVGHSQAQGILVAALGMLAGHYRT